MDNFIAKSKISKELINSANLLKDLRINALISGESGVGKKTLAYDILNKELLYEAKSLQNDIQDNLINISNSSIIIDNIDEITNIDMFLDWIEDNNIRVIALSKKNELNKKLDDIFSIKLEIPSLKDRKEDINELVEKFTREAEKTLNLKNKPKDIIINLSNNAHSLRESIYFSYLLENITKNEISNILEKFIYENLDGENNYRDLIGIFEVPLLKASKKKYKSQLQMSKYLGLNRVTLRKKLEIYKEDLEND